MARPYFGGYSAPFPAIGAFDAAERADLAAHDFGFDAAEPAIIDAVNRFLIDSAMRDNAPAAKEVKAHLAKVKKAAAGLADMLEAMEPGRVQGAAAAAYDRLAEFDQRNGRFALDDLRARLRSLTEVAEAQRADLSKPPGGNKDGAELSRLMGALYIAWKENGGALAKVAGEKADCPAGSPFLNFVDAVLLVINDRAGLAIDRGGDRIAAIAQRALKGL